MNSFSALCAGPWERDHANDANDRVLFALSLNIGVANLMSRLPLLKYLARPAIAIGSEAGGAASALWTFPTVLGSAILIAWAAEAAQFLISQGLALALLAWLQTLPEFAVEAVIAWEAGTAVRQGPGTPLASHATALMTANFTGSLRLLVGLGWPMIYATAAIFSRRQKKARLKNIKLQNEHSVEI